MTDTKPTNPSNPLPNAEDLRMRILEREMAEMEKQAKLKQQAAQEHEGFSKEFLTAHFTEHEAGHRVAADQGRGRTGQDRGAHLQLPFGFCTDAGRAINNAHADWPDTLQGKARELYDRYVEVAKPRGYKLKAMIINFPGGMPGDVGFYLSW